MLCRTHRKVPSHLLTVNKGYTLCAFTLPEDGLD